jgi:hypothetical protein
MATIKLSGGSFGDDEMMVRCDLGEAAAPVEARYGNSRQPWESTQYQCADARHTKSGLIEIGKRLAAQALEVPFGEFACEADEVK